MPTLFWVKCLKNQRQLQQLLKSNLDTRMDEIFWHWQIYQNTLDWSKCYQQGCIMSGKIVFYTHIKNILAEGELDQNSVIKDFLITASDGKEYRVKLYNLDMIISVGYRIKSLLATRFLKKQQKKKLRLNMSSLFRKGESSRNCKGKLNCLNSLKLLQK